MNSFWYSFNKIFTYKVNIAIKYNLLLKTIFFVPAYSRFCNFVMNKYKEEYPQKDG